jgi:hypothetical protein
LFSHDRLLITKYDDTVTLHRTFNQLPQAGDTESLGYIGGILAIALGFTVIDYAPALGGGYTDHEIKIVFTGKLGPAFNNVPVILRRSSQPGAVVNTVVVEEDTKNLVSLLQCCLGEEIGRVRRLVLIRSFVYLYC